MPPAPRLPPAPGNSHCRHRRRLLPCPGDAWPWPRRFHAHLIDRLTQAGASLIVFDVFFGEPSHPEDDRLLAEAIKKSGKVVLARVIESTQDPLFSRQIILNPLDSFKAGVKGLGMSLLTPDPDGVVRHFYLTLAGQKTLPDEVLRLLKPDLALPPGLSGLIHYTGPPDHLESLSYYQILSSEESFLRERVQGRVVLVGRMVEDIPLAQGQVDTFLTPYHDGGFMSGVEIQGNIIDNLLNASWDKEITPRQRLLLYLAVLLGFSLLTVRLSPGASLALLAALGVALVVGTWLALWFLQVWIPPFPLGAGLILLFGINLFAHHLTGLEEKRWLHQAFTHYVSQDVVDTLIAHPERFELGAWNWRPPSCSPTWPGLRMSPRPWPPGTWSPC